jgi:hypothetical protein
MNKILEWTLPIHTISEANSSEHWTMKHKRHQIQKRWIWFAFQDLQKKIILPCHIKLTRIGKRLLDSDNLPSSLKWVRDAVADHIIPGLKPGQADGDERISWEYGQQRGKEYAVIIRIDSIMPEKAA